MRSWGLAVVLAGSAAFAAPCASAAERSAVFNIRPAPLASVLNQFARQAGVSLLFDPTVVTGRLSAGLSGRFEISKGLKILLGGSDFTYQQLPQGGYAILILGGHRAGAAVGEMDSATTVPELLVVGASSLNADIPRRQDDVQPYQLATHEDIRTALADTIEDLARSRLPRNVTPITQRQTPVLNSGSPRSAVDFGGFGADKTLILVDGRRLASVPGFANFLQPDLNAIPMAAIERIETLNATASGIYGPGAIGGVVNVVLRRDFEGAELRGATGISSRGDARTRRVDGSFGVTSRSGRSRLMLSASYSTDEGLTYGDRDFSLRVLPPRQSASSLNIFGLSFVIPGHPALENIDTFLPLSGKASKDVIGTLIANAGRPDWGPSMDGAGTLQSLLSPTKSSSVFVSARQDVVEGLESFLDVLVLDNQGAADGPWMQPGYLSVSKGANGNPFDDDLTVEFPTLGTTGRSTSKVQTTRATLGFIAQLPHQWRSSLDLSAGRTRTRTVSFIPVDGLDFLGTGVDLFDPDALKSALADYKPQPQLSKMSNAMTDANWRIAGPLQTTRAGVTTLSVLLETRREQAGHDQSQTVSSGYAELRAPLMSKDGAESPLRGLEVQIAARRDRLDVKVPSIGSNTSLLDNSAMKLHPHYWTSTLTAGFKSEPIEGLLWRASYSTGYVPPTFWDLVPQSYLEWSIPSYFPFDPKRPGERYNDQGRVVTQMGGSASLGPERATTASTGLVLTPTWLPGLRFSIDYTLTKTSGDITYPTNGDYLDIFRIEDRYPGTVRRGPLTSDDIAKGYTVGPIIFVDAGPRNIGRSRTATIDIEADYRFFARSVGDMRIYSRVTWQPFLVKRDTAFRPSYQLVGAYDGPLALRANGGVDWVRGPWSGGFNTQLYSAYRLLYGSNYYTQTNYNTFMPLIQPGKIPAQIYTDTYFRYISRSRHNPFSVRVSVQNIFDRTPPRMAIPITPPDEYGDQENQGIGYSPYGDPRGRRFEFEISRHF